MQIKNARINYTKLGREDHGIMTFIIGLDFDGCMHQGVGCYALDGYDKETRTRVFSAKSMEAVSKILEVVGVDYWEQLPGKYLRFKDQGHGKPIDEIGNLMENKWFNLREFFSTVDI